MRPPRKKVEQWLEQPVHRATGRARVVAVLECGHRKLIRRGGTAERQRCRECLDEMYRNQGRRDLALRG